MNWFFYRTNVKKKQLNIYIFLPHSKKRKIILIGSSPIWKLWGGFENRYKNEKNENNNLDTIHSSIRKLTSFSCNYTSIEYNFLHQHYKTIKHDHNLQMFHILCLIETKIHHASTNVHKFMNSSKYQPI
jgi:hypothetical protein